MLRQANAPRKNEKRARRIDSQTHSKKKYTTLDYVQNAECDEYRRKNKIDPFFFYTLVDGNNNKRNAIHFG